MTRLAGWGALLDRYLAANRTRPFKWGEWDCCLFVCGAIEAMTGVDPAASFRGHYTSRAEAFDLMREAGGFEPFIDQLATKLGLTEVSPLFAGRGAVVLANGGPGGRVLGLIALNGREVLMVGEAPSGEEGIGVVPFSRVVRAWRV